MPCHRDCVSSTKARYTSKLNTTQYLPQRRTTIQSASETTQEQQRGGGSESCTARSPACVESVLNKRESSRRTEAARYQGLRAAKRKTAFTPVTLILAQRLRSPTRHPVIGVQVPVQRDSLQSPTRLGAYSIRLIESKRPFLSSLQKAGEAGPAPMYIHMNRGPQL